MNNCFRHNIKSSIYNRNLCCPQKKRDNFFSLTFVLINIDENTLNRPFFPQIQFTHSQRQPQPARKYELYRLKDIQFIITETICFSFDKTHFLNVLT